MGRVSFTERELDVMTVLWDRGPSTVSEVRELLVDDLAYTTVLTVLRTLEAKGYVVHEADGKAHRYAATVKREAAGRSALRRLVDTVFGGSRELLLAQLLEGRSVDEAELKRLRRILDERLREGAKGSGGER